MVERFFNFNGGQGRGEGFDLITLLSGPPSSGKTSLLFQYALNMAASHSLFGYVVFICNRRRFHSKPPFLSLGTDDSSLDFHRIHIKYIDDYDDEGIKKYFAAFHLLDPFPLAVIIDDFGEYFLDSKCQQRFNNPRGRDLAMVGVLALCHSAIIHANKTAACQLLLSDTYHGDTPRLLFIYKRWTCSIFSIQGEGPSSSSFLLKHTESSGTGTGTAKRTAKYSIALQYLLLEEIIQE